jgi:hypothetical protein
VLFELQLIDFAEQLFPCSLPKSLRFLYEAETDFKYCGAVEEGGNKS